MHAPVCRYDNSTPLREAGAHARRGRRERKPDRVDDITSTDPDYLELKRTLRALGDVVRLHIVRVLGGCAEITVTDLALVLAADGRPVSQPLVSWHLAMLRRAGLVRTRRMGRLVYCSLDRDRYAACLHGLNELVDGPETAEPRRAAPISQPAPIAPTAPIAPASADTTGSHRGR